MRDPWLGEREHEEINYCFCKSVYCSWSLFTPVLILDPAYNHSWALLRPKYFLRVTNCIALLRLHQNLCERCVIVHVPHSFEPLWGYSEDLPLLCEWCGGLAGAVLQTADQNPTRLAPAGPASLPPTPAARRWSADCLRPPMKTWLPGLHETSAVWAGMPQHPLHPEVSVLPV